MWTCFLRGGDCPDVEFIQLARPTLSLAKCMQMVGRGLRVAEGKDYWAILDNVGMYRRFGLPSVDRDWESMFRGHGALLGLGAGVGGTALLRPVRPRSRCLSNGRCSAGRGHRAAPRDFTDGICFLLWKRDAIFSNTELTELTEGWRTIWYLTR